MRTNTTGKWQVLFSLLFPGLLTLSAQETGKVLESTTRQPLTGVHIYLSDSSLVTITDNEGAFRIAPHHTEKGDELFRFSYVGFIPEVLSYSDLQKNNFCVTLKEDEKQLETLTVLGETILHTHVPYKKLSSIPAGLYAFGATLAGDTIFVSCGNMSYKEAAENSEFAREQAAGDIIELANKKREWIGYSDRLYKYNIQSDQWETVPKKFRKRAHHASQYYNGKLYMAGGKRLSTNRKRELLDETVEVYDCRRDTVLVDPVNPHQAADFAAVMLEDNMIPAGGSNRLNMIGEKEYMNKVHLFNVSTGLWYELSEMPHPKETKGTIVGNKLYLVGGFRHRPLNEIESYNLATAEWKKEAELPYEAERPAIACRENTIYIFENGRLQSYDTIIGEIKVWLIDISLTNSEMFFVGEKLYIVGGYNGNYPSRNLYAVRLGDLTQTRIYSMK
ncbi:MAG: carboxypeptidase-like regulatory domain-containing protein [Bacteroides sp.]|nr:carboxypeptidase-like regulatory domain-containing protein [Bacteroides sp.]